MVGRMNELAGVGEPAVTGSAPISGDPVRPPQGVPVCVFCGQEVNPRSKFVYTQATAWHRPGKAGGSDMFKRELLDRYACQRCGDLEIRLGVSAGQQALM